MAQTPTSPFGPGLQQAIALGGQGTQKRIDARADKAALAADAARLEETKRSNLAGEAATQRGLGIQQQGMELQEKKFGEETRQFGIASTQAQERIDDKKAYDEWHTKTTNQASELKNKLFAVEQARSVATDAEKTRLEAERTRLQLEIANRTAEIATVTTTRGQTTGNIKRIETEMDNAFVSLTNQRAEVDRVSGSVFGRTDPETGTFYPGALGSTIDRNLGDFTDRPDRSGVMDTAEGFWGWLTSANDRNWEKAATMMGPEQAEAFMSGRAGMWGDESFGSKVDQLRAIDVTGIRPQHALGKQIITPFAEALAASVGSNNSVAVVRGFEDLWSFAARLGGKGETALNGDGAIAARKDMVEIFKELENNGVSIEQSRSALRMLSSQMRTKSEDYKDSIQEVGYWEDVVGELAFSSGGRADVAFKRMWANTIDAGASNIDILMNVSEGHVADLDAMSDHLQMLKREFGDVYEGEEDASELLDLWNNNPELAASLQEASNQGIDVSDLLQMSQDRMQSSTNLQGLTGQQGTTTMDLTELEGLMAGQVREAGAQDPQAAALQAQLDQLLSQPAPQL